MVAENLGKVVLDICWSKFLMIKVVFYITFLA